MCQEQNDPEIGTLKGFLVKSQKWNETLLNSRKGSLCYNVAKLKCILILCEKEINLDIWLKFPSKILKACMAFSLLLMVKCEREGNKLRKDKEEKEIN